MRPVPPWISIRPRTLVRGGRFAVATAVLVLLLGILAVAPLADAHEGPYDVLFDPAFTTLGQDIPYDLTLTLDYDEPHPRQTCIDDLRVTLENGAAGLNRSLFTDLEGIQVYCWDDADDDYQAQFPLRLPAGEVPTGDHEVVVSFVSQPSHFPEDEPEARQNRTHRFPVSVVPQDQGPTQDELAEGTSGDGTDALTPAPSALAVAAALGAAAVLVGLHRRRR